MHQETHGKPTVVFLPWIKARPKDYEKFCSIYTSRGFDVIVVNYTAYDLIKPSTGGHVIAKKVVKFLKANDYYDKIVIKGISGGAYIWGECLTILDDTNQTEELSKRIKCQIWDSVPKSETVPQGLANVLFPENQFMKKITGKVMRYLMHTFYSDTFEYYRRPTHYYMFKSIKAPTLVFSSITDGLATEADVREMVENWKQQLDVTLKLFDNSPHTQHYRKNSKEYLQCIDDHLKKCDLNKATKND